MAEFPAGTIVDGRYKLVSRLGAGGMADVFLAEDQQLGRKVAVKLLHRRFAEDPGFVERFRREAQAAAGLQHPNVVSVYDRGAFDDTYYIAMEYLPGRTLKQLIRQEAPLDPVRAIDITIQILKAARFAHKRGVIHRDLKPHNVIVDDSDHAKVTDFGIARAGASDMTETGSIMGTAQYLSPEQAQGHAVSATSDLYSVGVVLYELLTGRVPFDAESAVTIALKHVSEWPAAPTVANPSVPPELEQIVMWALNKNPADRPKDADQFIAALEHAKATILSGTGGQRTASMAALAAVGGAGGALAGATGVQPQPTAAAYRRQEDAGNGAWPPAGEPIPPPEPERSPIWPWIALLVALLLIGGGVAAYLLTRPVKEVVPSVIGEQLNTARTEVQNASFGVNVINVTNPRPAGIVIGEDPQGGAKANQNSTVTLTVSQGPGTTTVPSVEGLPLAQAKAQISQQQLAPGRIVHQSSDVFPAGQVIGTDPSAGSAPPVGTKVTIFVSSGKPKVTVPSVTGNSEPDAKAKLTALQLNVTTTSQTTTTVPAGNVISQSPAANSQVLVGSTVTLVIAKAPTTATVPTVTGQTGQAATTTLTQAGFKVTQQNTTVTKKSQNGLVVTQSPAGNTTVKKGSTVTIVVGKYTPPTTTTTTTTTTSSSTISTPALP
jgi:eukaryotic-like serine/threonine-protein kinase